MYKQKGNPICETLKRHTT